MTVQEFKDTMVDTMAQLNVPVYHILAAPEAVSPVLCWQELGSRSRFGSDRPVVRIQRIQVDYFSTDEYDETYKAVEEAFHRMVCGFNHDGKTYDTDRQEWRDIWTVQFLDVTGVNNDGKAIL